MLTIFTVPKPFSGHLAVIQSNAIKSWLLLSPRPEIILFGGETGTAETASRLGLRHVPDIECNEYGTPLVSSVFGAAQRLATHHVVCYVNADIVLMDDFVPAVRMVQTPSFLLIGRRWNIEQKEYLDLDSADWQTRLRARLAESGKLHAVTGIDYFVFPRGLYDSIPPFAIGRTAWDNWLVYRARVLRVPVVDATEVVTAVHQDHDYSHHPAGGAGVWKGPEAQRNRELAGGFEHAFTVRDATWILTASGMKRVSPLSVRFRHWARLAGLRAGSLKARMRSASA